MNCNTTSTHRLHAIPPAPAASAALAANVWAAIPASHGSPPGCRAGPGLPAAWPGRQPASAAREGGRS